MSQNEKKLDILTSVAYELQKIDDRRVQANLSASTAILSGLVLEERDIQRILRSDIMKESTLYQAIQREEREVIALNLLKIGMKAEQIANVTNLPLEEVKKLQQKTADRK